MCHAQKRPRFPASQNLRLIPVARAQVKWLTCPHVFHDLLDVPWLVLVSWRVVWLNAVIILEANALVHGLDSLLIVLVGVSLWVVAPDPLGKLWSSTTRVELDLLPVRLLEKLSIGEAELLGAGVADEARN